MSVSALQNSWANITGGGGGGGGGGSGTVTSVASASSTSGVLVTGNPAVTPLLAIDPANALVSLTAGSGVINGVVTVVATNTDRASTDPVLSVSASPGASGLGTLTFNYNSSAVTGGGGSSGVASITQNGNSSKGAVQLTTTSLKLAGAGGIDSSISIDIDATNVQTGTTVSNPTGGAGGAVQFDGGVLTLTAGTNVSMTATPATGGAGGGTVVISATGGGGGGVLFKGNVAWPATSVNTVTTSGATLAGLTANAVVVANWYITGSTVPIPAGPVAVYNNFSGSPSELTFYCGGANPTATTGLSISWAVLAL